MEALIGLEVESFVSDSRVYLGRKSFREVQGVGDRHYDQVTPPLLSPFKYIVEHFLVDGFEVIQLIYHYYLFALDEAQLTLFALEAGTSELFGIVIVFEVGFDIYALLK